MVELGPLALARATGVLENCAFNNCVWHLDLFVGDRERFQALVSNIGPILMNSLPSGLMRTHHCGPFECFGRPLII